MNKKQLLEEMDKRIARQKNAIKLSREAGIQSQVERGDSYLAALEDCKKLIGRLK